MGNGAGREEHGDGSNLAIPGACDCRGGNSSWSPGFDMNLYALQYSIAWEDRPQNFDTIGRMLDELRPEPGSLVVLPELSDVGFSMNHQALSQAPGGESYRQYAAWAGQWGVHLVAGCCGQGPEGKAFNLALVHNAEGQLVGSYAKQHPFSFAGETRFYESGTTWTTFDWAGCKVAPVICYDLRFPELFRHLVLAGSELFLVIANWPSPRVHHWEALLKARAIENQAYVLGVNRCGQDPKVEYPGATQLWDPQGQWVARLENQPGVLRACLDLEELRAYRQRFPALSDLKPELLGLGSPSSASCAASPD